MEVRVSERDCVVCCGNRRGKGEIDCYHMIWEARRSWAHWVRWDALGGGEREWRDS